MKSASENIWVLLKSKERSTKPMMSFRMDGSVTKTRFHQLSLLRFMLWTRIQRTRRRKMDLPTSGSVWCHRRCENQAQSDCPGTVSCADILAIAARDVVVQALVVLVHDLGPSWELVGDAINSTLHFKCIFRKAKECKERNHFLMDETSGDGTESIEDSGQKLQAQKCINP